MVQKLSDKPVYGAKPPIEHEYLCQCDHDISDHGMARDMAGNSRMTGCREKNCPCGRFLFKYPEIFSENDQK